METISAMGLSSLKSCPALLLPLQVSYLETRSSLLIDSSSTLPTI